MNSAYLYIRVSTDEQKRKGYSLPEQEDRLLRYCESNNIEVKGIFREDFSAKNFNRPEWKKLVTSLKKSSIKEDNNILFVKWDRFSRNIELAYEMIGILRKYKVSVMAIDQPIDFSIPESSVMLAVYLSIPDAENGRRALNTANGMRRARESGRYPNKAPLGFTNLTMPDGRKYIAHSQPDADILKWCFQQLSKNAHTIEEVRRMGMSKGLKCSRSNFWKLIRNPVYCGLIILPSEKGGFRLIKALHEPLISEKLFYDVQSIINSSKQVVGKTSELKETFPLVGYLTCPACSRRLRGSFSKGVSKKYPYYHCSGNCRIRFRAEAINKHYSEKLQALRLSDSATELFNLVLEDANNATYKGQYLSERATISKQLEEQDYLISRARKLFVAGKLQYDDFRGMKEEYQTVSNTLKEEFKTVMIKLESLDEQVKKAVRSLKNIFHGYDCMKTSDKKQIISLVSPGDVDIQTGSISLRFNNALAKILRPNVYSPFEKLSTIIPDKNITSNNFHFIDRKISTKKAGVILAKNNIQVSEEEAAVILDLLYHIAQCYDKPNALKP